MPLDLSMFKETGFDPSLPGSGLMPGFANEIKKREQLQIAQELQRRMAEEQLLNQPNERAYKDALTQEALARAANAGKDKTNLWQQAQADSLNQAMDNPLLAGIAQRWKQGKAAGDANEMARVYKDFQNILPSIRDARVRKMLEESGDPMGALMSIMPNLNIQKEVAGIQKAGMAKEGRENVAVINYHAAKYRADAMERAKQLSASTAKTDKPLSMSQAYAKTVLDDYHAGKLTVDQVKEQLAEGMAAGKMVHTPNEPGAQAVVGEDGKTKITVGPKPPPKTAVGNNDPLGIRK